MVSSVKMIQSNPLIVLTALFLTFKSVDSQFKSKKYFISTDKKTWDDAKEACVDAIKGGGSLVAIETEDEYQKHKEYFAERDIVGDFWTAGKYDPKSKSFVWDSNGQTVPDGRTWFRNPWPRSHPKGPNANSRLYLHHAGLTESYFISADKSDSKKYICEDTKPTRSNKCARAANMDFVFGVDNSYSMKDDVMESAGKLMVNITKSFYKAGKNRFAFFLYTDNQKELHWSFHLKNKLSLEDMVDKIEYDSWYLGNYGDKHSFGIQTGATELLDNKRKGAARKLIMITDGETNPKDPNPIKEAKKAINKGIDIYVVRMFSPVAKGKPQDLVNIAGGNEKRVFTLKDEKKLLVELCAS